MDIVQSDKDIAIQLRKEGKSLNQICAIIKRGKGTVFSWIRNIDLNLCAKEKIEKLEELVLLKVEKYHKLIIKQKEILHIMRQN